MPGRAADVAPDPAKPLIPAVPDAEVPNGPAPATPENPADPVDAPVEPLAIASPPAPALPAASSLAALVAATPMPDIIDPELRCLAAAVYFESRAEPLAGQLAVAHVVINRAASPRFPGSLCAVVHQHRQFHFLRGGQIPAIPENSRAWETSVKIARIAQVDGWANAAPGALFFHARRVSPGWKRPRVAQIDNHIFYR